MSIRVTGSKLVRYYAWYRTVLYWDGKYNDDCNPRAGDCDCSLCFWLGIEGDLDFPKAMEGREIFLPGKIDRLD